MPNLIEAKPFIWQFARIDTLDISGMEAIGLKEDWHKALSAPFSPEEIPDILEGWYKTRHHEGYIFPHGKTTDSLFVVEGRYEISKDAIPWASVRIENGYSLNDFLSDLHRAGIAAHFSPKFIEKHQLK